MAVSGGSSSGRVPLIAVHRKSGVTALNVVTAALETEAETAGRTVVFARRRDQVVSALDAHPGAVVAWSFYSTDFLEAAQDLRWVRARSDALHVVGGVHATAEPKLTLRAGFDLLVRGEGEATMVALMKRLDRGEDPRDLPGVGFLDGDDVVLRPLPKRRPLDDFPAFNARFHKRNPIEITRGCVYACSFCQTPFMFKARFRHRSVQNVRWHVDQVAGDGGHFVRFLTPTSLSYGADGTEVNLDAVEALLATCREGIGSDGKIYFGTFPSELRPEHVSPEAMEIIARYADNRSVVIGAQSGSDRTLSAMRRGHDVEAARRAVRVVVEAGFEPHVDFLFGLPGEQAEEHRASLRFAEELVALGARIHNHSFMPLPGTPLAHATPSTVEPDVDRALRSLEGKGSLFGKWKGQRDKAGALVQLRRKG